MALTSEEITKLQALRPDVFKDKYYSTHPDEWMQKYGAKEGVNIATGVPAVDPNAQLNALRNAYMASLNPSQDELDAETSLKNLVASKELGMAQVEDTSKNPVAMAFIQGQQGQIEKSAALKALPLQTRLAALQSRRQAAMDVNKFAYETEANRMKDLREEDWRNKEFNENVRQFNVQFKQAKKDKKSASKAAKSSAKSSAKKAEQDYSVKLTNAQTAAKKAAEAERSNKEKAELKRKELEQKATKKGRNL